MAHKLLEQLIDEFHFTARSTSELTQFIFETLKKRSFPLEFLTEYSELKQLLIDDLTERVEISIRNRPTSERLAILAFHEPECTSAYKTWTKLVRQYERTLTKSNTAPGDSNVKTNLLYEVSFIFGTLSRSEKSKAQQFLRPLVCKSLVMNSIAFPSAKQNQGIYSKRTRITATNQVDNPNSGKSTQQSAPTQKKSSDKNTPISTSHNLAQQKSKHIAIDTTAQLPIQIDFVKKLVTFNSNNGDEIDRFFTTFFQQRNDHRNLSVQLFLEAIESYYE